MITVPCGLVPICARHPDGDVVGSEVVGAAVGHGVKGETDGDTVGFEVVGDPDGDVVLWGPRWARPMAMRSGSRLSASPTATSPSGVRGGRRD